MLAQVWVDPKGLVDNLRYYESKDKDMEQLITSSGYAPGEFAIVTIEVCVPSSCSAPDQPLTSPPHPPRDHAAGSLLV